MELREYLRILFKRWWLIIPLTLISLVTALLLSYFQTPIYEATSTYVTTLDSSMGGDANTPDTIIYGMDTLTNRQRIFVTYCQIMTSDAVRTEAYQLVNVDLTGIDMKKYKVVCSNPPETNILSLSVQGPSPTLVKRLNEAIGLAGSARANGLYNYFPVESLDPVKVSDKPVFPKHTQNGVLGAAFGLLVGITAALMIEYLRSPLQRMEAMSIRHPQLGIYNERYFRQRFEEETNRAHARLRPISVALLRLNPTEDFAMLPEPVKTMMLRNAALTMQDILRQGDLIAYLKPMTFGILLPETPGDDAQNVLQKLHMDLRARTFEASGYVASFSANTGVVSSSGGGLGYQPTLEKAGEALGIADESGDNSIHLIRATPRPFVTAEDSEMAAPSREVIGSPFGSIDLDRVTWEDNGPSAGAPSGWMPTSNGSPQDARSEFDRPGDHKSDLPPR